MGLYRFIGRATYIGIAVADSCLFYTLNQREEMKKSKLAPHFMGILDSLEELYRVLELEYLNKEVK